MIVEPLLDVLCGHERVLEQLQRLFVILFNFLLVFEQVSNRLLLVKVCLFLLLLCEEHPVEQLGNVLVLRGVVLVNVGVHLIGVNDHLRNMQGNFGPSARTRRHVKKELLAL